MFNVRKYANMPYLYTQLCNENNKTSISFLARATRWSDKKMKKKKDPSKVLMLLFGAKTLTLGAALIAATFVIAKKALIIGKIALIISAIIWLKKFLVAKKDYGASYGQYDHHGYDDWYGGGSGWLRRVTNGQDLAYSGYSPKQ